MSFMHMNAFCRYILVAIICFSLMGSCLGGEGFCIIQHNNAKMSNTSHRVHAHAASAYSHLPSGHESHQVGSPEQCCRTSSKDPSDCARIFVLPNKTKTVRGSLIATFSTQIAINCFQLSEKNLISEISNAINPTLVSLRTVILLV
jgi:hypothetical protein